MSHLQVAVLRGGPSVEYSVSMNTGAGLTPKTLLLPNKGSG